MNFLMQTTVYLTVTAIILLLFKRILKNKLSAKWQVCIWAVLLIRLLMPSLPQSAFSVFNAIPTDYSYEQTTAQPAQNETAAPTIEVQPAAESAFIDTDAPKRLNMERLGLTIWGIGAAALLLYFLLVYAIQVRKVKKRGSVCDETTLHLLNECKKTLHIKRRVQMVSGNDTPMLMGMIKPKIILPGGYSLAETKNIILHELCHLKNGDIVIIWIAMLVLCLNWFNPVIWYCFFVLRRDIEVYCDQRVLQYTENKKEYATLLLKTALRKNKFVLGTTALQNGEKEVERRIKYMAYFKKPKVLWSITIIIIAVAVAAVCLTNAVGSTPTLPDATAIVVQDTTLYADEQKTQTAFALHKNDVVQIVETLDNNLYFVQLPIMETPPVCGFVSGEDISFDAKQFSEPNYGVITNAIVLNSADKEDVYSENESGVIQIQEYSGKYARCSLIGGVDDKWVLRSDISYDFSVDTLYAKTVLYLAQEFYRVYSPYYEILNLQISDWQQTDNEATFFYTMTHKNFDKDPDTVGYIREAKERNLAGYEQLKREYLEPKEANYEFKVVLEGEELALYHNASPRDINWQPVRIDDFILN